MGKILQAVLLLPLFVAMTVGANISVCTILSSFGTTPHHHVHVHVDGGGHDHSGEHAPCGDTCFLDLSDARLAGTTMSPAMPAPIDLLVLAFLAEPQPAAGSLPAAAPSPDPPDRLPRLESRSFTGRILV